MTRNKTSELPDTCSTCHSRGGGAQFMRHIFRNGSENLVYVCRLCRGHMSSNQVFWPKGTYWGNWEDLPIFRDERTGGSSPCWVQGCGNKDTELHHFAPKEFWKEDANAWPMAYLCRYHHRMWHDVMSGVKLYSGDYVLDEKRRRLGLVTFGDQQ